VITIAAGRMAGGPCMTIGRLNDQFKIHRVFAVVLATFNPPAGRGGPDLEFFWQGILVPADGDGADRTPVPVQSVIGEDHSRAMARSGLNDFRGRVTMLERSVLQIAFLIQVTATRNSETKEALWNGASRETTCFHSATPGWRRSL